MAKLTKTALTLLISIAEFGDTGTYAKDQKALSDLEAAGFVETNRAITDDSGNVATRVTSAGAVASANGGELPANSDGGEDAPAEETKNVSRETPPISGIVSDVPMPKATRRSSGSAYPFDQLEVGQSFFVAATDKTPEPVRTLSSTCSRENARYAVETGNTTTNRKGDAVPETELTRRFIARKVDDGAAWGEQFVGQSGCAVYRVALD